MSNTHNNNLVYGRKTQQIIRDHKKSRTYQLIKRNYRLVCRPHVWRPMSWGHGNPYVRALLTDLRTAASPQSLLPHLQHNVFKPPFGEPLSERQRCQIICAVAVRLWELAGRYLAGLSFAVGLVLYPDIHSRREVSNEEQPHTYGDLRTWPGNLLRLHAWITSHLTRGETVGMKEHFQQETQVKIITQTIQSLYNKFDEMTHTLRGISQPAQKKDGSRKVSLQGRRAEHRKLIEEHPKYEQAKEYYDLIHTTNKSCSTARDWYRERFDKFVWDDYEQLAGRSASTSLQRPTPASNPRNPHVSIT